MDVFEEKFDDYVNECLDEMSTVQDEFMALYDIDGLAAIAIVKLDVRA